MPFIQFQSLPLTFKLRRSARAKRLQMILKEQHFEVVAPFKFTNQAILQFIFSHQHWMAKHYQKQKSRQVLTTVWPKAFAGGETITFRGKKIILNIKFAQNGEIALHDETLHLVLPWGTPCLSVPKTITHHVIKWYQEKAKHIIEQSVAQYCPLLDRWPKGVQLKQQKSRWGSCGSGDKIYLNWLLVLAPPGVLEYVVVHELCHLLHRNHGKRFWQKVAFCMPHYQQYEKWLTQQGQSLKPLEHFNAC